MKKRLTLCVFLFALVAVVLVSCSLLDRVNDRKNNTIRTEIRDLSDTYTTKYGNLNTKTTASDFTSVGFEWGDLVKVTVLNQEIIIPVVPTYSYVDSGKTAVIMGKDDSGNPAGYISLAINMGDFTTAYGLGTKTTNEDKTWYWTANEGVTFPIEISFTLEDKGGYLEEYSIHDLNRTNNRDDYSMLTDEQFANFRKVNTSNMKNLYRSSNPVNAELGRNTYADKAIKDAGVTVILNLADNKETAEKRAEFLNTYYSQQNVIYLNLGVDFSSEDFKKGLADGLRFMATNQGVYLVHCTEGKDRAGFVSALLECLKGATLEEVISDYMETYYNYYGVEKGTRKYDAIANSNIVESLQQAFNVDSLETSDLVKEAEEYLRDIGLNSFEIYLLKSNL